MPDASPENQDQPQGWLYRKLGKALGPISTKEIRQLAETGKIRPTDLIRPESGNQWIEAQSVSDLFPQEALDAVVQQKAERNGPWKAKNIMVVRKGYPIPNRCILTNEKPKQTLNRRLHTVSTFTYLLLFINFPIFLILYSFSRQTIALGIPLSEEGMRRRKSSLGAAWLITLVGALTLCACFKWFNLYALLGGSTIFFFGLFYTSRKSSVLVPLKMTDHYAWLKGVCPEYLEPLPEWKPGKEKRK